MSRIELDEENLEVLDDYELSSIIIELCDTVGLLIFLSVIYISYLFNCSSRTSFFSFAQLYFLSVLDDRGQHIE